jgi:hypothetical protein
MRSERAACQHVQRTQHAGAQVSLRSALSALQLVELARVEHALNRQALAALAWEGRPSNKRPWPLPLMHSKQSAGWQLERAKDHLPQPQMHISKPAPAVLPQQAHGLKPKAHRLPLTQSDHQREQCLLPSDEMYGHQ